MVCEVRRILALLRGESRRPDVVEWIATDHQRMTGRGVWRDLSGWAVVNVDAVGVEVDVASRVRINPAAIA